MISRKMDFVGFLRRFNFCHRQVHNGSVQSLSSAEKVDLLLQVAEECQTPPELHQLVKNKPQFTCYDGFEPSGRMHVAQGLFKAINVNRCIDAGGQFVFWIADWFALMNDKMGGELQRIRLVGKYFVEVWKACGMKMDHVVFKWASEEINSHPKEYWKFVLDIAKRNSLSRIKKCCQIMGRKEGSLSAAQIMYPLMQCSDIFFLKADICQLGLDQRKVNMLARDYCDQISKKLKPIILSHHMIHGLTELREDDGSLKKMSKSNPDSAIFMEDSEEEVNRKILNAYCPKGTEIDSNPCLDYIRCIVFAKEKTFLGYGSIEEVKSDFLQGTLSEEKLKIELARCLNSYIAPVREHFTNNLEAKNILSMVRGNTSLEASVPATSQSAETLPHAVAWLYPTTSLRLLDMLQVVNRMNAQVTQGGKATILFADWSAEAMNCALTAKEKNLDVLFEYTSQCLKAYGLDSAVRIVRQSNLILNDSDTYWLGVIEIGRKLTLSQVSEHWGSRGISIAGGVLAALMHINDIRFLNTTDIVSFESPQHPACPSMEFSDFAINFLRATFQLRIENRKLRHVNVPISCDCASNDIKKQINKLYAPLKDTSNALIDLAESILLEYPNHAITALYNEGKNEHKYSNIESLKADYANEKLHPGDLKSAVSRFLDHETSSKRAHVAAFLEGNQKLYSALKVLRKK